MRLIGKTAAFACLLLLAGCGLLERAGVTEIPALEEPASRTDIARTTAIPSEAIPL